MLLAVILIIGGLALLVVGGESLVRGAAALARRMKMSALVIGLTVVSVATSAPELAVTTGSVLSGASQLALGNVVGSNIANLLLVLGVGAIVTPLLVQRQLVRKDLPIMFGFSVLLLLLALDGELGRWDGLLFLVLYVTATALTVYFARKLSIDPPVEQEKPEPVWASVLFVVVGVAALVGGARLLVDGCVTIAASLGISDLVVGLTVVALGTSLPELAATVAAVRRGQVGIAVGNAVGSNIANIGLVLGLPAMLGGKISVAPAALSLDIPLMLATALVFGIIATTGMKIRRWEGVVFVSLYLAYICYLVLAATKHDALNGFTAVMVWFVLPLVATVSVALLARDIRNRRRESQRAAA